MSSTSRQTIFLTATAVRWIHEVACRKVVGMAMNEEQEDFEPTPAKEDRSPSTLQIYYRQIARFPILSREEEQALARQMAEGVAGARERLIVSNLRLVTRIAQEYADTGMPVADIIQEGTWASSRPWTDSTQIVATDSVHTPGGGCGAGSSPPSERTRG
jgi:DNA-directed RNA polymerase sigma subunit (sigma70/sigma32)